MDIGRIHVIAILGYVLNLPKLKTFFMTKNLLKSSMMLLLCILGTALNGQCLEDAEQYPSATFIPGCTGEEELISEFCFTGEYSLVQVTEGIGYTFSSDVPSDYITIGDENGEEVLAAGFDGVDWVATSDTAVRFYLHLDGECNDSDDNRSRIVLCNGSTSCDVVEVPYTMGFEEDEMTDCLTYEDLNGGNGWAPSEEFETENGDSSMLFTYNADVPGDDWFYTPGINLAGGTAYNLTFKFRGGWGPLTEDFEVKYGNSAAAASMFEDPLLVFEDIVSSFEDDYSIADVSFTPSDSGIYYIGFHSYSPTDHGYIQIDDISLATDLGVDNFDTVSLSYFPNPVSDELNLSYSAKVSKINVYNLLGQEVAVEKINNANTRIGFSHLAAGSYLVKITSGNSSKIIKVLKQ